MPVTVCSCCGVDVGEDAPREQHTRSAVVLYVQQLLRRQSAPPHPLPTLPCPPPPQDFLAADGVMDLGPGFDPLAPFPSIQLDQGAALMGAADTTQAAAAAVAAAGGAAMPARGQQAAGQPTTLTSQLQQQTLATTSEATANAPAPSTTTSPTLPTRSTRQRRATSTATAAARGGGGGEGGGGRESEASKNMRKHLALQEKNRRAQRRFRERQKQKVAELEAQVASLTSQLAAVAAEKAGLEQRAAALEKLAGAAGGGSALTAHPAAAGRGDSAPSSASQEASGSEDGLPAALAQDLRVSLRGDGNGVIGAEQVKAMTPTVGGRAGRRAGGGQARRPAPLRLLQPPARLATHARIVAPFTCLRSRPPPTTLTRALTGACALLQGLCERAGGHAGGEQRSLLARHTGGRTRLGGCGPGCTASSCSRCRSQRPQRWPRLLTPAPAPLPSRLHHRPGWLRWWTRCACC